MFIFDNFIRFRAYIAWHHKTLRDRFQRITVPLGAASPEIIPPPPPIHTELVEKDVFLTGEVNFLGDEEAATRLNRKNLVERIYSVAVHVAIIALLIWPPKFLRRRPPTPGDLEIARKQIDRKSTRLNSSHGYI